MERPKVAILATHPIQYQAPWFRVLARHPRFDFNVLFCTKAGADNQARAGFGVPFDWDVPLLDGYRSEFLTNAARRPSLETFFGLDNPALSERIQNREFDAVVINGWHYKSAWQAMRACWQSRVPVLMRGDSHLKTPRSPLKAAAKEPIYRWFIPKLDACLPVGSWSRDYFLHFGASPERVHVVPHTVDSDGFYRQAAVLAPRRAELRARWDLPEEAVVYAFAGKLIPVKRPLDFVEALGEAGQRYPQIHGLIAGDGPLRRDCEQRAAELGARIHFTGFLNQTRIVEAYVAADALVMPSVSETWGLAVNEAMTCGRPCFVSSQVGCGPDLIVEGKTGSVFPMGDVAALTATLERYGDAPALSAMGRCALSRIAGHTPNAAALSLAAAVERTLGIN